jgi:hypothetical protein
MNRAVTNLTPESEVTDPLALLRAPFPANLISKLRRLASQERGSPGLRRPRRID